MLRDGLQAQYKYVVKALVRSSFKSRVKQAQEDVKRQIATMSYRQSQLVRQQAKMDNGKAKSDMGAIIGEITQRIEDLKTMDHAKSKKLLFYPHTQWLRSVLLENGCSEVYVKRTQHLKDVAGFLKNQQEYEELYEQYHPAMNMLQEEKIRRTAAKVGLKVPNEK